MNAWDDRNFGIERTNLRLVAAVDANTFGENAVANNLLRDRLVRCRNLRDSFSWQFTGGDLGRDCSLDGLLECVVSVLTRHLVGDLVHLHELVVSECLDLSERFVRVVVEHGVRLDFLRRLSSELLLGANEFGDEHLRRFEALRDDVFVGLDSASLDEVPRAFCGFRFHHHDGDVFRAVLVLDDATGDDEVENGLGNLVDGRERDPVAIDENHANTGDRAREREARNLS